MEKRVQIRIVFDRNPGRHAQCPNHCEEMTHPLAISFRVIPCFILQSSDADEEVYMMEEALKGKFQKYLINNGNTTKHDRDTSNDRVCLAFARWTLESTKETLVLTDLQGIFSASPDLRSCDSSLDSDAR